MSEAWKDSDRVMIMNAVERTIGFETLNRLLKDNFLTFLKKTIDTAENPEAERSEYIDKSQERMETVAQRRVILTTSAHSIQYVSRISA